MTREVCKALELMLASIVMLVSVWCWLRMTTLTKTKLNAELKSKRCVDMNVSQLSQLSSSRGLKGGRVDGEEP